MQQSLASTNGMMYKYARDEPDINIVNAGSFQFKNKITSNNQVASSV